MATAPKNARDVRVKLAGGRVVERAHWASDLTGEEQPAFQGWFEPIKDSNGAFLHYAEVQPVFWMPVTPEGTPPASG
jgi:hypothetical protein